MSPFQSMVRDNGDSRRSKDDRTDEDRSKDDRTEGIGRRDYMRLSGSAALALSGLGLGASAASAVEEGGPENTADWQLAFEDTFESGSLDTSKWTVGYGWGLENGTSRERIVPENVFVEDGRLHLQGTHDGDDYKSGAVNTKDKATFGPGTYWEAKIKMPNRVGFLPAFWSKPNSEAWPPELDFVELFLDSGDWEDVSHSAHSIHYSTSTEPGDESTYTHSPSKYDSGVDLTQDFHVYGCKWMEDRIVHYVDGQKVAERTDPTILDALENGAPFYMMLNIHIDKIGTADPSESWGEALVADWVRVWEHAPGEGSSSDDTTSDDTSTDDGATEDTSTDDTNDDSTTDDSAEDDTSDDTEHYFWVRSGDGSQVSYAFEASGGNIRIDEYERSDGEDDEWVSEDRTTAGGVVAEGTSNYDGFWYEGEIIDLKYSGPIETFIDDEWVDPETLVDPSRPGPSEPDAGESTEPESSLPRSITFDGSNADGRTAYSFTVSDSVETTDSVEDEDTVSDRSVTGSVGHGSDTYRFSGEVTELSVDGDVDITIDDTEVDLLRIERAPESRGSVLYAVETTGRLLKADVPSASANGNDAVDGNEAHGWVGGGADAYWVIGGDVVDVSSYGGNVIATVDDTRVE